MAEDLHVTILNALAKRLADSDESGVELTSEEHLFFVTREGQNWLSQTNYGPNRVSVSAAGLQHVKNPHVRAAIEKKNAARHEAEGRLWDELDNGERQ